MVAREQLDRQQCRASAGWALVVEASPQQLLLRAPPKLADRSESDRPLTEVTTADRRLELVAPAHPQIGEITLGAGLRERVRLLRSVLQRHEDDFTYTRRSWLTVSY